jgi:hypothetical protein
MRSAPQLASYNERAARLLKQPYIFFGGYCATFDDGYSLPAGNLSGSSYSCFQAPLYEAWTQGLIWSYRRTKERCGHAILIEKINECVPRGPKC